MDKDTEVVVLEPSKYEAHITFDGFLAEKVKAEVDSDWRFSVIAGDPELGGGEFAYLTARYKDMKDAILMLQQKLMSLKPPYIRAKIEVIVLDTKLGIYDPYY